MLLILHTDFYVKIISLFIYRDIATENWSNNLEIY